MRILGIDIGSTRVKAVELESAFGRYEIEEYHELKVQPGTDPAEAARTLLGSLPKTPDRIAVALPSRQVTFRNLQLPTRDKKAIQATVGFELEDDLPFSLDDAVYDYSILSQTGQASQIHVAATLTRNLEGAIRFWQSIGADPDLITTEAWAYRVFMNRILSPEEQKQPILVLEIGAARTSIYVHLQGAPIASREIPWGGVDITAAIARKYGVAEEQAESAKLDHGFILSDAQRPQATTEQIEFSDAILESLAPLLHEVRQAELTAKNAVRMPLSRIYVSGGTSQLPGLLKQIEEEIRIPTQALQSLSAIATSGVTYSEPTDAAFLLATGLALCFVGPDRNAAINFRKGAYARAGKVREFNVALLKRPALGLAAIMVCLVASLVVQASVYQSRMTTIDEQLTRSIRGLFGQISQSAAHQYLQSPSTLKTRINSELKQLRDRAKLSGPNPHSPLGFLKDVSASIPKDITLDLMHYQVGAAPAESYAKATESSAALTFYLQSADAAHRLTDILGKKLEGLKHTEPAEVTLPDGTKRWKVEYSGTPTEESYGK